MSTTRSRAKGNTVFTTTDNNSQFDAAMHIGDLSAKISQLQVTVTASEAETKQTVTEMRFELRRLQERYAKLLDALREQRREHLDTAKQLAALQHMSDKLLTVLRVSSKRDDVTDEMHGHTRAESMVSDLDDARSEISSAVSASTARYAHSSLEAARASIRRS